MLKKIIIIIVTPILLFLIIQVINAEKYEIIVNVVDGKNIVGLNLSTNNLDFGDMSRGGKMTRYITIKNNGIFHNKIIIWEYGELAYLVKSDNNFFTLSPEEEKRISFELKIPSSAKTRKYEGNIWMFRILTPWKSLKK